MKQVAYALGLMVLATTLTGCAGYSLQELRRTDLEGNDFYKTLARYYLDFAVSEEKNYDWYDSAYFADKGLLAVYGSEVGPEELENWKLPQDKHAELEAARGELLAALTDQAIQNKPEQAAAAQFYFDCWVEQQEENWQADQISYCQDQFKDAMAALTSSKAQGEPIDMDTTSYVVFFQWGESRLSESGKLMIDRILQALEPMEHYDIVLNGHTDTAGDARFNLKLSQRRAEAVKQRLVEGGVKPEVIKLFAFGESDPKVKTGDGVREPANRRVEIFLNE